MGEGEIKRFKKQNRIWKEHMPKSKSNQHKGKGLAETECVGLGRKGQLDWKGL